MTVTLRWNALCRDTKHAQTICMLQLVHCQLKMGKKWVKEEKQIPSQIYREDWDWNWKGADQQHAKPSVVPIFKQMLTIWKHAHLLCSAEQSSTKQCLQFMLWFSIANTCISVSVQLILRFKAQTFSPAGHAHIHGPKSYSYRQNQSTHQSMHSTVAANTE